jgi:cytoskeletal protein RodZ
MDFSRNYILNIFIGVIVIFALIIFIDVSNINLNPDESNKKVVQIVNIEALKNQKKTDTTNEEATTSETDTNQIVSPPEANKPNTTINMSPVDNFCKNNSASLKESCAKLTKKNCNATTCCVILNGKKCVAGNQDGPTFKTESGKDINIDYYYFQNKCYGNGCPTK